MIINLDFLLLLKLAHDKIIDECINLIRRLTATWIRFGGASTNFYP
jgi:hypothetical protein